MQKKPLILVTNDDGVDAPGIQNLVKVAKRLGEVVVVAPDSPQSGQGHAITIEHPLRLHPSDVFGPDVEGYSCSGTPVDCVKLAKWVVLKDRVPDLCVSGINHGSNAAVNILYSGTMSAAMEASLEGIDSIGFSLLDFNWDADFGPALPYVEQIMRHVLANPLQDTKLLNVNIPYEQGIKGVKICRQANARWEEHFLETKDPRGRKVYWLTGEFKNDDVSEETDIHALENDYISIVPSGHDLTRYPAIEKLRSLEKIGAK